MAKGSVRREEASRGNSRVPVTTPRPSSPKSSIHSLPFVLQLAFGVFGAQSHQRPDPRCDRPPAEGFRSRRDLGCRCGHRRCGQGARGGLTFGLSYGRRLAIGASRAILVLAFFATLDQLQIAPALVRSPTSARSRRRFIKSRSSRKAPRGAKARRHLRRNARQRLSGGPFSAAC